MDTLSNLIRDTLLFARDPLGSKQPILTSAETAAFFKKNRVEEPTVIPKVVQKPVPPVVQKPQPRNPDPPKKQVPVVEAPVQDLSPIKKTLQNIAPSLKFVEQVPDDTQAKRIASAWREKIPDAEVVLLGCDSSLDTLEFLKGLAKAIDHHLAKAKILMAERLERERRWDLFLEKNAFRLIIASDGLQKLPELMRFYKAFPASGQFFLDKIPLFVLSPAAIYKSVEHKALLWKTLCQILKK